MFYIEIGFDITQDGAINPGANIDGMRDAIDCIHNLISEFALLQELIPSKTQVFIQDLYSSKDLLPLKASTRNPTNVLSKRLDENPILSCFTQTLKVFPTQGRSIRMMISLLLIWRLKNPWRSETTRLQTPTSIKKLCQQIRKYSKHEKTLTPSPWPPLSLSDKALFDSAFNSDSEIGVKFTSAKAGIRELSSAIKDDIPKTLSLGQMGKQQNVLSLNERCVDEEDEPTLQSENFKRKKLYPSENDNVEEISEFYEEDTVNEVSTLFSYRERLARLSSCRFRSALDNQYLPYKWEALNAHEVEAVVNFVVEQSPSKHRILALLTIATSLDSEHLFDAKVVDSFDPEYEGIQIQKHFQLWCAKFPKIRGHFKVSEANKDILEPVTRVLYLPLPKLISEISQENVCGSLGQLLGFANPVSMSQELNTYCTNLRDATGIRVTPLKLRSILFNHLMIKTSDEVMVSRAINTDSFSPSISLYYASFDAINLQVLIRTALNDIGLSPNNIAKHLSDQRYGSELFWSPKEHVQHIEKEIQTIELLKAQIVDSEFAQLKSYHNKFVAYVSWVIHCSTGHRERRVLTIGASKIGKGWCLADDKIKEYENPRLLKLSSLVEEQLEAYNQHLKSLSHFVKPHDAFFARKISALGEMIGRDISELPYFFIFEETNELKVTPISTKKVYELLNIPKNIPHNLQRHWYITGLREQKLPAEWIAAASGHVGVGQMSYGYTSLYSLSDFGSNWNKALNAWLTRLGFRVLTGLLPSPPKRNLHLPFLELAQTIRYEQLRSAPVSKRPEEVIHKHIKELNVDHLLDDSDQQNLVSLLAKTYQWSIHDRIKALNHLKRSVSIADVSQSTKPPLKLCFTPQLEKSSITNNHIVNVQRIDILRSRLAEKLPNNLDSLNRQELASYTALSLTLNSGIVCSEEFNALWPGLFESLVFCEGHVWLEWYVGQRLVRRFLDVTSLCLLLTMRKKSKVVCKLSTTSLLKLLRQLTINNILFCNLDYPMNLRYLRVWCTSWLYHYLPGSAAAASCGDLKITSLSTTNLMRMMTGKFILEQSTEVTNKQPCLKWIKQTSTPQIAQLVREFKKLKCIINDARLSNLDSSTKFQRSSRTELIARVNTLKSEWENTELSVLLVIIADYSVNLLKTKKQDGSYLKHATIYDYVSSPASSLLALTYRDNWLDLSEDELEQYYLEALTFNKSIKLSRLGSRLRYFHDFCVQQYGQEPINLSSLDPAFRVSAQNSKVRASVITTQEYEMAKAIIAKSSDLAPFNQSNLLLLLFLIFRFGLRLTEAITLDTSDITISGNEVTLLIRDNRLASPKSRAGFRQVVCRTMDFDEIELFATTIKALKSRFEHGIVALFSDYSHPWQIVSRSKLSQQLLKILKYVTGSQNSVIHDARHTFATVLTTQAMMIDKESLLGICNWNESQMYQTMLLGHGEPTRRLSYALSSQLGHASPVTTFQSYSHGIDVVIQQHLTDISVDIRTAKLSHWTGISASNIRQIKFRTASQGDYMFSLIKTAASNVKIPSVKINFFNPLASDVTFSMKAINSANTATLEAMVCEVINGCDASWLSKHYFMELSQAKRFVDYTHWLREDREINVDWFSSRFFDFNRNHALQSKKLIDCLEKHEQEANILADVWLKKFIPTASGLLVGDPEERRIFIDTIDSISGLQVEIRARTVLNVENAESVQYGKNYRSRAKEHNKSIETGQITVRLDTGSSDSTARLMKSFNRFLFLTAIKNYTFNSNCLTASSEILTTN
ncbi:MAG: hypothetical protein ABNH21_15975 [Glaciecola sp.]